mgnify:CR=1 FL=1
MSSKPSILVALLHCPKTELADMADEASLLPTLEQTVSAKSIAILAPRRDMSELVAIVHGIFHLLIPMFVQASYNAWKEGQLRDRMLAVLQEQQSTTPDTNRAQNSKAAALKAPTPPTDTICNAMTPSPSYAPAPGTSAHNAYYFDGESVVMDLISTLVISYGSYNEMTNQLLVNLTSLAPGLAKLVPEGYHMTILAPNDETSVMNPPHANPIHDVTSFTPSVRPPSKPPDMPTIPYTNPQVVVEWEEPSQVIPLVSSTPTPFAKSLIPTPPPNSTRAPTHPRAPPWTLGTKTTSHLFLVSSNISFTNVSNPIPRAYNNPIPSTPQSSNQSLPPTIPLESINQPSLLGTLHNTHPPKASHVRSLKEIYEKSRILPSSTLQNPNLQTLDAVAFDPVDTFHHYMVQSPSLDDDLYVYNHDLFDMLSLQEALSGPEADSWRVAMDMEYQSLMEDGAWQLVPPPEDRQFVSCKWLPRKKFNADDSISRYKARLEARGSSQVPGMDYTETFSPMLRITSFRALLATAAQFRLLIHQMDVRTAFLHGNLHEEIYMEQPPTYISKDKPHFVCKLVKSLYGLKQSPRQWYERFTSCMSNLGYIRFQSDPNVYSRNSPTTILILAIYVDDILILSNSNDVLSKAKSELHASFSMQDMGALHYCLGIQVFQDPSHGLIHISQQSYVESLLKKYNMSTCKGVSTPLPISIKAKTPTSSSTMTPTSDMEAFPYANIHGGIRYLVTCTRPDICFATNFLSRYMQAPSPIHTQHVKRLLRYLQETKDFGITYSASQPLPKPYVPFLKSSHFMAKKKARISHTVIN